MKPSPPKISFNYPSNQNQTHLYSPRLIQSGFIVGQPIAYTDQPYLPPNYQSFSPNKSRPRAFTQQFYQSRRRDYEAPEPSQFAPPIYRTSLPPEISARSQTVPIDQYNRLLANYQNLSEKYAQLQEKYNHSKYNSSNSNLGNIDLQKLIERYKRTLLDECKLLIDRARLQQKEMEFSKLSVRQGK